MTLSLGLLDHCLSTFRGEQHLCPLIKGCQIVMISAQIPESVSSILTMKTFNENCFCMFFFRGLLQLEVLLFICLQFWENKINGLKIRERSKVESRVNLGQTY